jgi:hypothetical protein
MNKVLILHQYNLNKNFETEFIDAGTIRMKGRDVIGKIKNGGTLIEWSDGVSWEKT